MIGLTIVSCGTSSPELAASLAAALKGSPAIAVGNVVGSNIANLTLVLGATAAVWPLRGFASLVGKDTVVMLAASLGLFAVVRDDLVSHPEGFALLAAMVAYLVFLLREHGRDAAEERRITRELETGAGRIRRGPWFSLAAILGGVGLLVLGANFLVSGAVGMARSLGVSERVIGLTIVAFGTSLPELAASVVAALRHHSEIVIGNLIGSNIFNILLILGATAAVHPIAAPWAQIRTDLLVMLGVAVLAPVLLLTGSRLSRWEGGLLLLAYGLYVGLLFR